MRSLCVRHARRGARTLSHGAAASSDAAEAFAALAAAQAGAAPPGLYGVPGLRSPSDFTRLAQDAVRKVDGIVSDLALAAPSEATVRALDDISDTVCAVVDAAELCRQTHPSRAWAAAAEGAYVTLSGYVARLNGDSGLYAALCAALAACAAGAAPPLSAEGARVAASLRAEFERGGIHLGAAERARLEAAQAEALDAGSAFSANLRDAAALGSMPLPRGAYLPPAAAAWARGGRLALTPEAVATVLSTCSDERLRRAVHAAAAASPAANRALLQLLLRARADAASLLGFSSHAALATAPLLARTPAAPLAFCAALSSGLADAARDEMALMARHRADAPARGSAEPAAAWERPWLMARARAAILGAGTHRAAAQYFPLRAAVEGLALQVGRLFGVTLAPAPLAPGEAWAPGVRKLAAWHAGGEGPLGCVYLDLRPRRRKLSGAAHFVIQAGRAGCATANAPPRLARVALVASLGGGGGDEAADDFDDASVLLSHGEVELLWHEAGHAMHSLLSRTSYQHLSGTRGPQDCVEAPSTLLERLAWHPAALATWARQPGSGAAIPAALVARLRAARAAFAATDAAQRVAHAAADLALHGATGAPPPATPEDASALAAAAAAAAAPWWPAEADAAGEARFGHLVGYGGTYYAYLYGEALSGAAWRALGLEEDPLAPEAGGRLWRHVLRPGGSAEPVAAFSELLGANALQQLGGGWAPDAAAALSDILRDSGC